MRAINDTSGTAADPLNHGPTLEDMERVSTVLPATDLTWYRVFLAKLYDPGRSVYAKELQQGDPPATTLMHAVGDNKNASFGLSATVQEWDDALELNPGRSHPGRDALKNFLTNSPVGQLMKPKFMDTDNVGLSKSQSNMYFTSNQTSFKSLQGVMTVGELRDGSESSLQDLRSMILTSWRFLTTTPRMLSFPSSLPAATRSLTLTHYARVSSTSSTLPP